LVHSIGAQAHPIACTCSVGQYTRMSRSKHYSPCSGWTKAAICKHQGAIGIGVLKGTSALNHDATTIRPSRLVGSPDGREKHWSHLMTFGVGSGLEKANACKALGGSGRWNLVAIAGWFRRARGGSPLVPRSRVLVFGWNSLKRIVAVGRLSAGQDSTGQDRTRQDRNECVSCLFWTGRVSTR
jgi:hypothetical protein